MGRSAGVTPSNSRKIKKAPFIHGGTNMKIVIHKNLNGDTRTAHKGITFKQLQKANDSHIADVRVVMDEIGTMLCENGEKHD